MAERGLTEKQRLFCDEYLIDLNATRAYMAAYPSVKKEATAAAAASRLLKNVKVSKFVHEHIKDRQERTEITQDEVLKAIKEIAFDIEVKTKDRLRALEMLCKHLGVFDGKDALDRKEQEARIAKLQREAQQQGEDGGVNVTIMGMTPDEIGEVIG